MEDFSDIFSDLDGWQVVASGQAVGRLSRIDGPERTAGLQLDFDFHGGGGFVVIRREVRWVFPEAFEIGFSLRGAGLRNHFEFKVVDGANAWRFLRQDYELADGWERLRVREGDLPFAWGPAGGGAPVAAGAIELVIAAGPGGAGSVCFAGFSLTDESPREPRVVAATSEAPGCPATAVLDGNPATGWHARADDPAPSWFVDFGRVVRFGGLVIDWPELVSAREFLIEVSDDGAGWTLIHRAQRAGGRKTHIATPKMAARWLRVGFPSAGSAGIRALSLRPVGFTHTPNEFIHAVAADFPRGWFPRYWLREQSYWTPVGTPEGGRRALINEEGMVEVDEGAFSLEPFLLDHRGRLLTWAEANTRVALAPGGAPCPEVSWQVAGLTMVVRPWVDGAGEGLALRVSYQVDNPGGEPVRLVVAARPFQVVPPWQAFRDLGGRSPICEVACDGDGMRVAGRRVVANRRASAQGAASFEEGGVLEYLGRGELPPNTAVNDAAGLASAALAWEVAAGGRFEVVLSVGFFADAGSPDDGARARALAGWNEVLGRVVWRVPAVATEAIESFRTALGHVLINRDGAALQPGPRRYTRSWVRDCVLMGAALAKAGSPAVLREFVDWYVQFQRADGFVPCVVDRDGVDWLVEHDSHGQWIWGICEVFRHGGGREFLEGKWPSVRMAAAHLLDLRAQRLTAGYAGSACHGLLPESASHEGYLAHPVHSYWDDFWGVRGLCAAAELAEALGLTTEAARWRGEAAGFLTDVLSSLDQVIGERGLNYIPGSVEWADFDPTATANAIAQLDFADALPGVALQRMLDTYLEGFRGKHRGEVAWVNYTAYEIRIIGAMVRVGRRDDANELLEFFLGDQRPAEWNQWPEISWRDVRAPGHLGDVPHTWIAAEYMLAVAQMVASEREEAGSLVLASGLPWAWVAEGDGFGVSGLMTRFGILEFALRAVGDNRIGFEIGAGIAMPAGGLFIDPPVPTGARIVTACDASGRALETDGQRVRVVELPVSGEMVWRDDILSSKVRRHPVV